MYVELSGRGGAIVLVARKGLEFYEIFLAVMLNSHIWQYDLELLASS
jgi:hypothetical protein